MDFKLYLAGPITGSSYSGCTNWREDVKSYFEVNNPNVLCYSPMRGKGFLKEEDSVKDSYDYNVLTSSRGIITRDYNDCRTADVILVNMLGNNNKISIGTVMEIAWAKAFQIPVVAVFEDDDVHEHSMINECIGYKVYNIDSAIKIVETLLLHK